VTVAGSLEATVEALCGDLLRIRAPGGVGLNARSWSTEAPLRMLLNNLDPDVAERPAEVGVTRDEADRVADVGVGEGRASREAGRGARATCARSRSTSR